MILKMKIVVIFFLTVFYSATAYSALTGTALFRGVVSKKVSLTVTAETGASALNLASSQTNLKVATLNEVSNSNKG